MLYPIKPGTTGNTLLPLLLYSYRYGQLEEVTRYNMGDGQLGELGR